MNDQFRANFPCARITKLNHFRELVTRIDMEQRKRNLAGIKSFLSQPQHHRRVLAYRIEHHGMRKLSHGLAKNIDTLSFERLQMVESSIERGGFHRLCWRKNLRRIVQFVDRLCHASSLLLIKLGLKTKIPPARASGGGFTATRLMLDS